MKKDDRQAVEFTTDQEPVRKKILSAADWKVNWHSHTFRCKHAEGDVADYCRTAIENGVKTLGISDHMPTPDGRWSSVRMTLEELPDYCRATRLAAEEFPDLDIYLGLECEYIAEYHNFYKDEFIGRHGIEFLSGAIHLYPYKDGWRSAYSADCLNDTAALAAYTRHMLEVIDSGLFVFIAHPDLFGAFYDLWDAETEAAARDIAEAARETHIPLEINAYGLRKQFKVTSAGERPMYPWLPFWEIVAEVGAPVIVNSDAHRPQDIAAKIDECFEIVRKFDLQLVLPSDLAQLRSYKKERA